MFDYLNIAIPCFSCFFWFIVLVCRWNKNYRSQKILAITMLVMAISFYTWSMYLNKLNDYYVYYKLDILDTFFTLSIYPLTSLYFKSLTDERPLNWKNYIGLMPALLIGGCTTILYWIMGKENAASFIQDIAANPKEFPSQYTETIYTIHYLVGMRLFNLALILQVIFATSYAIKSLIRYHKQLKDFYSNLDDKSIKINYGILVCFLISLFFSLITSLLGGTGIIIDYPFLVSPLSIAWGAALNYLGYLVVSSKYTVEGLAADLKYTDQEAYEAGYGFTGDIIENEYDNEVADNRKKINPEFISKFNQLIEEKKIFQQKDLRLADVACEMRTNRTYISRLLNEEYQCSFSDFINNKRIEYAQKLALSNPEMSQEEIAGQSGFTHPSSFSRTFKQHSGITFREWQRRAK